MNHIQRAIFLFTNGLFVAKYTARIGLNPYLTVLFYGFVILFVFWIVNKKTENINEKNAKLFFLILFLFLLSAILCLNYCINPLKLQVDRWSAINNFIHNLFQGIYPYAAHTHLGGYGSPFPVWQIFHIPFYLLGNIGLGMFFAIFCLGIFLIWYFENYLQSFVFLLFLAVSPAFWYEVAVRSDLIYNFIFCLIAIVFLYKKSYSIQNKSIGLGVLCGLFLSTRLSVFIPFALFLFPEFLVANLKSKIVFMLSSVLVFFLTFLPFILGDSHSVLFFKYNPFVLQTRQGSIIELILLLSMIYYFSIKWKNNLSLCFSYIAITIVVFVAITFFHRMILDNFTNDLFSSSYDITYFSMALPFVIFALTNFNQKKFQPKNSVDSKIIIIDS
jgi:hypothetical protein